MKMKTLNKIIPPAICAVMGGAEFWSIYRLYVLVKLPGREDLVKIPRKDLPTQTSWTAFTLADAAHVALEAQSRAAYRAEASAALRENPNHFRDADGDNNASGMFAPA